MVVAFIDTVAADSVIGQGRGGAVAGRPLLKCCRSFLGRQGRLRVASTAPSTTERRYSTTVIPLACACADSPASSSGLRFRVTVISLRSAYSVRQPYPSAMASDCPSGKDCNSTANRASGSWDWDCKADLPVHVEARSEVCPSGAFRVRYETIKRGEPPR